jgi:hypothetical protein
MSDTRDVKALAMEQLDLAAGVVAYLDAPVRVAVYIGTALCLAMLHLADEVADAASRGVRVVHD